MIIYYSSTSQEKIFNNETKLQRVYGELTKVIKQRLFDLDAANCLEYMKTVAGRIEELTGDLEEHFSLRLSRSKRLIFRPANEPIPRKEDSGLDWTKITEITIIKIEDYHGS